MQPHYMQLFAKDPTVARKRKSCDNILKSCLRLLQAVAPLAKLWEEASARHRSTRSLHRMESRSSFSSLPQWREEGWRDWPESRNVLAHYISPILTACQKCSVTASFSIFLKVNTGWYLHWALIFGCCFFIYLQGVQCIYFTVTNMC